MLCQLITTKTPNLLSSPSATPPSSPSSPRGPIIAIKMARDNDELVHSISSSSLPSPQPSESAEDRPDSPSEEDVAAFDRVFAQFDPNNLGVVSMRDFLAIIDELDALRPKSAKPLLTEVQREQSLAFTSSEGGTAEMTRDQLFQFIKEMTGNKIIVASPKKKIITKREDAPSPTKSEVQRRGLLPGISAKSQVRAPHNKRRGDLERMADGTTNIIAEDNENFSAVPVAPHLPQKIPAFNLARRNASTPIVTSTPMPFPRRQSSPTGETYEGYGSGPMSPTSPIASPPMRPQDWQHDKGVQDYIGELQLQQEEHLKKVLDQERLSNARLREQDILITELQEKLDATEDELKEKKKELGELRSKEIRMTEIVYSMEKEVERREIELESWRERYLSVKKSYDEQLTESEKLRDMILTKEGENNQLQEKINSLKEDVDTFVRVSWQFAGERQSLHDTIAKLQLECTSLKKTEAALRKKENEASELTNTVMRLKYDLEEMRKRVNGSEKGTLRPGSIRSIGTIGRSDSVRGKPEILAHELAQDDEDNDTDDTEGYIETVVRTEKRKVRGGGKKDKASAMQLFKIDLTDQSVQATPSTQTISTQTILSLESTLANMLRNEDNEDTLRSKIDALAEGLGSQRHLIDQLLKKSKTTESTIMSESAVIRKHGPPPPYEAATQQSQWRWPKFLTVSQEGEVSSTGWMTFVLWSVVLFFLGLTTQSLLLPRHDLGGLYPDNGYASAFEMFGQRHWWEKWGMDTPWGRLIWRFGWWVDELLRSDGGWPS